MGHSYKESLTAYKNKRRFLNDAEARHYKRKRKGKKPYVITAKMVVELPDGVKFTSNRRLTLGSYYTPEDAEKAMFHFKKSNHYNDVKLENKTELDDTSNSGRELSS